MATAIAQHYTRYGRESETDFMPLFLYLIILVSLPLVEIGVFIWVGSEIGIGWTLLLVVASFILGVVLLRRQSLEALKAAQVQMRAGVVPGREMAHAAMIVLAAVLLMVPGFVTDIFGLALFIPRVRDFMFNAFRRRAIVVQAGGAGAQQPPQSGRPEVIDLTGGEFSRSGTGNGNSPWEVTGEDDEDSAGRNGRSGRTLH